MSLKYNEEFKYALRDIANNSFKLENQFGNLIIYVFLNCSQKCAAITITSILSINCSHLIFRLITVII